MKVEQKAIDDSDLVGDDDEIEIENACNGESGRAEKVADEVEFVKTAAQLRNLSGTSVLNCALSALRCDRIRIRTKMILLVADEMKKSFDICLGLKTKYDIRNWHVGQVKNPFAEPIRIIKCLQNEDVSLLSLFFHKS